ncbi:MAG: MMPL family transporter [Deltaproteobacteria bacterium]|nr:MMPL family transporter [Deltaproteobacteria bacterium]
MTSIPMGYWSAQLFADLRADLKELLPENAKSVQTLRKLEARFGNFAELSILVKSSSAAANRRFTDDLVAKLAPSPLFRSVRNRVGEEADFFYERRHLFVETEDLETIRERIEDAATEARTRANPLIVELDDEEDQPITVDFSDIEKKYSSKLESANHFPNKYFESKDGTEGVIICRKKGTAFGISENRETVGFVDRAIAELNPGRYAPDMTVRLGGDVKNMIEEHESLVADLLLATAITSVLLALVVLLYYGTWRSLWLVGVPLLVGLAWTFGLGHFLVGYVNASSAFLGPIAAGNGINYGVVLFARYVEERRKGQTLEVALERGVVHTARGTSGAALAAGIAYVSLVLTDNRGFIHFGLIAGVGMVLCWIATFTVMPPLIRLSEKLRPMRLSPEAAKGGRWGRHSFDIITRAPRFLGWLGIITAVAGAVLTVLHFRDPFEMDYSKLRSRYARDEGASSIARRVDEIFGRYSSPQVILTDDPADVPAVVQALNQVIDDQGDQAPISEVLALSSLVPDEQEQRIETLKEIRRLVSENLLSALDDETRALAEKYRPPERIVPFAAADLPESIRADFREKDGSEGKVILVFPNYKRNLYDMKEIKRVADVMRSIKLPNGKVVESSGNFVIYDDMLLTVSEDGPRASLLSLLGVIILSFLLFRGWRWLPVAGALLVGVSWMGGLMYLFDLRINFLNFIALPITIGIGVDYAVNIYARYLIELMSDAPHEATEHAVSATGGAVILCSLTTIIGYGSLLVADNGSLVSFGDLAVLGELTCLSAAMIVMPAWLYAWSHPRRVM